MMKRTLALLLALLLLGASALADEMMVVNCDEWVSLRETPSTSATRLRKVPLGSIVEDCEWMDNGFVRCTYQGATGYILEKYLEPMEPDEAETVLDAPLPSAGVDVLAFRQYDGGERLTVTGFGEDDVELWSIQTGTGDVTELTATAAFIGGTADQPRVMVYNCFEGLSCLDPATGEAIWKLDTAQARLGAGITHAVDADGTLFICGYYGPDPVCIDVDGHVLWQSDSGSDDIYWPYEITLTDRGVETRYAMMPGETEGIVVYDISDGHVIDVEYD